MYDKSGAWGTRRGGDRAKKWDPVGRAMKDFFADATSKDLKASLDFFPQGSDVASICSDATYGSPQVSVRALPDGAFGQAIDAASPTGPTPTAYAMRGALGYAKGLAANAGDEKVILLLVTDGLPGVYDRNGRTLCSPNTIDTAAGVAAGGFSGSPSIATYVIGVADQANPDGLANLDRIAQSGGTQKATIVQTNDPTKTKTDFAAALARVRGEAVSCDFAVPPPPDGKTIDFGAVNVTPHGAERAGHPPGQQGVRRREGRARRRRQRPEEDHPLRVVVHGGQVRREDRHHLRVRDPRRRREVTRLPVRGAT